MKKRICNVVENPKFNFLKKEKEEEMYNKIRKRLIKNGYKPLNNITYTFSFDCKETRNSFFSPKYTQYPYSITITTKYQTKTTSIKQIKKAA